MDIVYEISIELLNNMCTVMYCSIQSLADGEVQYCIIQVASHNS